MGLPSAALTRLAASETEELVVLCQDDCVVASAGHSHNSLAFKLLDSGRLIDLLACSVSELALVVLHRYVAPGVKISVLV